VVTKTDVTTSPRTGDTVTEPVRVRTVNPIYPPLALAAQIEGDVVLNVVVSPEGRVTGVDVVRPAHPLLDAAAQKAVLQYSYRPGLRNGVPDTFRVRVTVSFKIE
jgi:protein TonB